MLLTATQRILVLEIACDALLAKLASPDSSAAQEATPDSSAPDPRISPDDLEFNAKAGCFVSLHERDTHRLRGCVGRLDPQLPLWQAVKETAADVLTDPRFTATPVTIADVPALEIEVSVLSLPRLASGPLDFEPTSDGIYLVIDGHSGFFLPQVARETGWGREQLLSRLCEEKLALAANAWQHPDAKLYTFSVEVIGPQPLHRDHAG